MKEILFIAIFASHKSGHVKTHVIVVTCLVLNNHCESFQCTICKLNYILTILLDLTIHLIDYNEFKDLIIIILYIKHQISNTAYIKH